MNEKELRNLMYTAQLPDKGPFVIRYPRGRGVMTDWECEFEEIQVGTGRKLKDGDDMAILTIGPLGYDAQEAIAEVEAETEKDGKKLNIALYDMRFVKPLDGKILDEVGRKYKRIITVENGVRNGGFGSAILEWMDDHGYRPVIERMGLPDSFVEHGTVDELKSIVGIDKDGIKKQILKL